MTNNHNYSTPQKGATDWHLPLNNNFEQIDTDVEVRDLEQNLSEYTPESGAKFMATDSGAVFLGDGSTWTKANAEFARVDATRLGTNGWWVDPRDDQTGIEDAIAAAEPGDYIFLKQGTYVVDNPYIAIDKEVHIRGWGQVVVRLQDNLTFDQSSQSVFEVVEGGDFSSIKNIEINGNASNNTFSSHPDSPFSHGLRVGGRNGYAVEGVVVESVRIRDTIRSGLVVTARNSSFRDLWIADSATDHHIYLAGSQNCYIENVWIRGTARISSIVFGTSGKVCKDSTIKNVDIRNLAAPQNDDAPNIAAIFRQTGEVGNNTLKNLVVRNVDNSFGSRIVVNQPYTTLENVLLETQIDKMAHLDFKKNAAGSNVVDLRMEFPTANRDRAAAIRVMTGPLCLRDVRITETTGSGVLHGIQLDPASSDIPSLTVDGLKTDIGRTWLRGVNTNYATNRVRVDNFHDVRSNGVSIASGAEVWYAQNGYAAESATAEQPQGIYPEGTLVEFTDTGDGSGSGNYFITPNGPLAF